MGEVESIPVRDTAGLRHEALRLPGELGVSTFADKSAKEDHFLAHKVMFLLSGYRRTGGKMWIRKSFITRFQLLCSFVLFFLLLRWSSVDVLLLSMSDHFLLLCSSLHGISLQKTQAHHPPTSSDWLSFFSGTHINRRKERKEERKRHLIPSLTPSPSPALHSSVVTDQTLPSAPDRAQQEPPDIGTFGCFRTLTDFRLPQSKSVFRGEKAKDPESHHLNIFLPIPPYIYSIQHILITINPPNHILSHKQNSIKESQTWRQKR